MKLDIVLERVEQEMIKKGVLDKPCKNDHLRGKMIGLKGNSITIYRNLEKTQDKDVIPYFQIAKLGIKNDLDLNYIFKGEIE